VKRRRREVTVIRAECGGFCAHSGKYWLDYVSLCWQNREQKSADHKEYDHISKVPVDTVNPGFHALNSHHYAMGRCATKRLKQSSSDAQMVSLRPRVERPDWNKEAQKHRLGLVLHLQEPAGMPQIDI
jgi:hypothetical protein